MRKFLFLSTLIALCACPTLAQDRSRPELFVGYSHENISSGVESSDFVGTDITDTTLVNSFKVNGFNVSGTGYLTRRFGVTGDFSAGFERRLDDFGGVPARTRLSLYNVTVGPQVNFFNARRATPFVRALFGVARRNLRLEAVDAGAASIASATDNSTNFTMNLGGGLDVRLNDRVDLRVFQLDYNPIFLRNRTVEGLSLPSRTAHGARLSIGLVFK